MPQISRIRLRKEIEERMYQVFFQSIVDVKNTKQAEILLNDLLTPTEKVMQAKRLAIALLLLKHYDYSSIRQILKVGYGTICKVSNWLKVEGSGYRNILEKLLKQEKWLNFLDQISKVFKGLKAPSYSSPFTKEMASEYKKETPL